MRRHRTGLFKGRHFEPEIITLCVHRYFRYALSLRNLEEIMAERNVQVTHVTILQVEKLSALRFTGKERG
jgi:transposase-like protein